MKVLLVDTNFSSLPILNALKKLNFEVHVLGGGTKNNISKIAESYWEIDYSDINSLQKHVDVEKYDFVVPGVTDQSYISCSSLNLPVRRGFDSHETVMRIQNKQSFKNLLRELNIPSPKEIELNQREVSHSIIVKPTDSYSGKGISIIKKKSLQNHNLLKGAIETARANSKSQTFLIEEYIEGSLYSYSAFISNREVLKGFLVSESCNTSPFIVDTSYVNPSWTLIEEEIRGHINKISKTLHLEDGLFHTQFIWDGSTAWILESTRRCPGDLYSKLIETSTEYPYIYNYIAPFVGLNLQNPEIKTREFILRHTITVRERQFFSSLKFNNCPQIEHYFPLETFGNTLDPTPHSRVGIVFCKTSTYRELTELFECFVKGQVYEV